MNRYPPRCEGCRTIRKERVSWRKVEARAINVCRSGPPLEYVEDSEEDETPSGYARLNTSKGTDFS